MELGLRGKSVIVTGASRGIGRAVALALLDEGAEVLLVGRDRRALDAVVCESGAPDDRAIAVAVDLTAPDATGVVVNECVRVFGRIDALVNNAGGAAARKISDLTDDDWRGGFELNFFAPARLAVAAALVMRERGWGRIVNVASTSGREPDEMFAPYSAAKAALINLSANVAQVFSKDGVLSNCVLPGVTRTELVENNAAESARTLGTTVDQVMARMMARRPVAAGRFGQPHEVAAAILFLLSEQSAWITGATLAVDGGTMRAAF